MKDKRDAATSTKPRQGEVRPQIVQAERGIQQYLTQASLPPPGDWAPDIVMWQPIYLEGYGNACRTANGDGQQSDMGCTSLRMLRDLAEYYTIDYAGMRDRYKQFVDKSQWPPLVIAARNDVFFAMKTRVPQDKNDGATGYIADSAVSGMDILSGSRTRIHLHNGLYVDALESRLCLSNRRNSAVQFKRQLQMDGIIPTLGD